MRVQEKRDLGEHEYYLQRTEMQVGIWSPCETEAGWCRDISGKEKGTLQVRRSLDLSLIFELLKSLSPTEL